MAGKRILIVDDERMVRETMEIILKLDGHTLDLVESASQALACYQPGKYDLILTDNRMPGITGLELATQLKARNPAQPIIIFSGSPPVGGVPVCDLVMLKPVSAADLRKAVARIGANAQPPTSPAPKTDASGPA
jgi:CheY-like chemotaxis protein